MTQNPMTKTIYLTGCAMMALTLATPAHAQSARDRGEEETSRRDRVSIDPYIEVNQIGVVTLSPGDDAVTYTQVAAGVDASINGRNNGGSVSLRYEYNIGYDDETVDSDSLSGVARGYASIVPNVLTVEAGGLATRTRVDGNGGATLNPLNNEDSESRIYSVYAGPTLATRVGDVSVGAQYQIGYTRVEQPDALVTAAGVAPVDVFDDSVSQRASLSLATQPGEPLPVGLAATAGYSQEDISNLDQRIRDAYVRGDVTVPLGQGLAVVGGVGYENVEVSSRDALRDGNGVAVRDEDGRIVTDESEPRRIAFEADGLIWDVGVAYRPNSRMALEARYGRRYDSDTYYGSFAWQPDRRTAVNISAYDAINGFGGQLNTALSNLPTEFTAGRNSLTGDFGGCVSGSEGSQCLDGALGSVRSSTFRSRGVSASVSRQVGGLTAGIGAGYDRRKFLAAEGTVLAAANGLTDESYYGSVFVQGDLGRNAGFTANAYANQLNSGLEDGADLTALGASAAYNRSLTDRLSVRAAVALDHIDSDLDIEDLTAASGLVGVRFGF